MIRSCLYAGRVSPLLAEAGISKGNAARPQPPQEAGRVPRDWKAGQMPEQASEAGHVSAGERAAGWISLAICAGLALICVDLLSGGKLTAWLSPAKTPCGCDE